MGRPRRQESRRAHLVAATQRVLARDGLAGLRVREVGTEAGMSPASVLYYFPDSFQLAVQALDHALHAATTARAATAAAIPDPARRLVALVDLDIPDPVPGIHRALWEIPGQLVDHPELAALVERQFEEQTAVYRSAIGDLLAAAPDGTRLDVDLVARCLVDSLHGAAFRRFCGRETAVVGRRRTLQALEGVLGRPLAPHTGGEAATGAAAGTSAEPSAEPEVAATAPAP